MIRNVGGFGIVLAFAAYLATVHTLLPWLLSPLVGLMMYRVTMVLHDCAHRTLFRSTRTNDIVGQILGALTGVDFRCYTHQHWLHHRTFGEMRDPQGFYYAGVGRMTSRQYLWHLAKPLLGGNLRAALAESHLAQKNVLRNVANGQILIVIVVQLVLLSIVTGGGSQLGLALLPFVSGATFGLFFSQLRGIAEHVVVAGSEAGYVRSHPTHWLDRIFLYDLNFNFHAEHHAFPHVPSCHLHWMQSTMRADSKDDHVGATSSMFGTLRATYKSLRAHA
ncbi:MAG TPA: fatty acid desaturase [Steroidobacteraceae bacterium]|nr:fatty acid desaturase [Steroidobacteraceae bacterium]